MATLSKTEIEKRHVSGCLKIKRFFEKKIGENSIVLLEIANVFAVVGTIYMISSAKLALVSSETKYL